MNYREAYGLFICNGILFNHESPRRGETFVTPQGYPRRRAASSEGLQDKLYLGNLEARRDWGFAGDYVEAMWLMLQQDAPDDYVVATGESHSVRELVEIAFAEVRSRLARPCRDSIQRYVRPTEVDALEGDASKARERLEWRPKVGFKELDRDDGGARPRPRAPGEDDAAGGLCRIGTRRRGARDELRTRNAGRRADPLSAWPAARSSLPGIAAWSAARWRGAWRRPAPRS